MGFDRLTFVIGLLVIPQSLAGSPTLIRHVADILSLNDEASNGIRCDITATVTIFNAKQYLFFVQEGDSGVYVVVDPAWSQKFTAGDVVRIQGKTEPGGYAPVVSVDRIDVLGHGVSPHPAKPPTLAAVHASDRFDGRYA